MNQDEVWDYIQDGAEVRRSIDFKLVYETGMQIAKRIKNGGKLVLFGNGGSAADSQHIAAELVGHFEMERKPLPAMALTVNTAMCDSCIIEVLVLLILIQISDSPETSFPFLPVNDMVRHPICFAALRPMTTFFECPLVDIPITQSFGSQKARTCLLKISL